MEQLFFAGKAYLKINSLVKTPLHEFMADEHSGLWAPGRTNLLLGSLGHLSPQLWLFSCILPSMEPLIACTTGKILAYLIYLLCMHAAISCTLSKSKHISLCIINV